MLTFRPRAVKELAGVPKEARGALLERLKAIAGDPRALHRSVKRLTGRDRGYRIRRSASSPPVQALARAFLRRSRPGRKHGSIATLRSIAGALGVSLDSLVPRRMRAGHDRYL